MIPQAANTPGAQAADLDGFLTAQAFALEMSLLGRSLDALSDIEEVFEARGSVVVLFETLSASCSAVLLQADSEICGHLSNGFKI